MNLNREKATLSKLLLGGMVILLTGTTAHAAGMQWDHEATIKDGIELFDGAYKQGGITEAENLSRDCHKKFGKAKDPQLLELCAAVDISSMIVDSQLAPQPSLQRKYFQTKAVHGRLKKGLARLGHPKNIHEEIVRFWGATTMKLLNAKEATDEVESKP